MSDTFNNAFRLVIGEEGGYVNDPRDPGGETKFGIAKRSHPDIDIANLTLDQARTIYLTDYWQPIRGDDLPAALAVLLFDAAVNQGPKTAVQLLQRAVGTIADGVVGPATLAAAQTPGVLIEFGARRIGRYAQDANWPIYGRGWTKRVLQMTIAASQLA